MREYKFRIWDNGVMYSMGMVGEPANPSVYTSAHWRECTENCIIMQCVGLKDKNGKDIFEGDIVRILYTDWPSNTDSNTSLEDYMKSISYIGIVEYSEDRFQLNFGEEFSSGSLLEGTHGRKDVIGNIYENAELLK